MQGSCEYQLFKSCSASTRELNPGPLTARQMLEPLDRAPVIQLFVLSTPQSSNHEMKASKV